MGDYNARLRRSSNKARRPRREAREARIYRLKKQGFSYFTYALSDEE